MDGVMLISYGGMRLECPCRYVKQKFPGSTLDLYADRGRSGYTFEEQEQYQAMQKGMLRRKYDILVVKDLSRFSRRNGQGLVTFLYASSISFKSRFTTEGFALPFDAFMHWPTKNPNAACFPPL